MKINKIILYSLQFGVVYLIKNTLTEHTTPYTGYHLSVQYVQYVQTVYSIEYPLKLNCTFDYYSEIQASLKL